jgi:ribonuclease R
MGRKNKKNKNKIKHHIKGLNKASLRGNIMQVFRENPRKELNYKQVSSRVGASDSESRRLVRSVLDDLVNLYLLTTPSLGKYEIHPDQLATMVGTIDFSKGGMGFVEIADLKDDVLITPGSTGFALQGDTVQISITGSKRGKAEGKVLKVEERYATEFVGILELTSKGGFLVPSNKKIHTDFYVDRDKVNGAKNGQKVIVKLLDWTDEDKLPFAEVITVLGDPGENDVEMHAILAEFGLPYEFPENVLQEADKIDITISEDEIARRKDFRGVKTFTIDPTDAKDFDDAISYQQINENTYEVGVHIADVSHYVKPGSILDKEASKRATSVYLVDRVVPMLPEVLSNNVCSLRPDEEKLCMSAVFTLDANGKVRKEWFGRTIIRSDKRFTYDQAQEIIEGKKGEFSEEITKINAWAKQMRTDRMKNGALEFSGEEVKFELDENGKPLRVYQKVMKEANFLIEEFMLLANKRVARFVGDPKKQGNPPPFVYRIHDLPDPDKLKTLQDFVKRLGYKPPRLEPETASRALNQLMAQIKGSAEESAIKQLAIRTMSKAVYSTENIGHYGLAFEYYTHFTSPIRRYPDVLVHRQLEAILKKGNKESKSYLEVLCKHSSNMEKRATDAERSSIKYKQVEFMIDKIGEVFTGAVNGLTKWGMFVELDDTKIEGMISLNTMDDDVYRYDEKKNRIVGTRYKEIFEFGDKVQVEVVGADLALKQLEFKLC